MDAIILKHITENQLNSCMNNTKWRELAAAINSREDFCPPVRIKDLLYSEVEPGFSPVWWNQLEREGYELIEWIQIRPIKEEHRGRFVAPKVTDFTEFVKQALEKHQIPYEFEDGIFTVFGYKPTSR